ncbi:assembly factor cbp4 [Candidozyma auris]|uniref:Cytochrome b mRNA-processing protein 4 n=1 Tax=Candidozyma auris TaxID=498019 RepID=A0A2H1A2V7_CANAR|nr:hypothetical protein QG37_02513 [[Candida] auris]PIS57241.1 hypothetical protein CJI97_000272 [[Candida] auris]PIS58817.1 hypothetical protein B9J08_000271 [[Candida] auris]PSK78515.1 hypothetical protein CJJ07_001612 [[Candida] auris]QEL60148.1 hypothetical protein CJJ09_002243 [[Candida] auris]
MSAARRPAWRAWARVYVTGACIIGTGVLLFKYTVPTDEELISRFSPEIRADYERNKKLRQQEQQELMKIVKETYKSNDPIWKAGPIKSPFEKDGRGVDPHLVDKTSFFKNEEDNKRKAEIEKANAELEETETLLKSSKKSWWKFW